MLGHGDGDAKQCNDSCGSTRVSSELIGVLVILRMYQKGEGKYARWNECISQRTLQYSHSSLAILPEKSTSLKAHTH